METCPFGKRRDPLCAKQVANDTGRPAFDAFGYYEALARVYLRGPNPRFQKKCDPLCAKQVAYFPEALIFPRDPLCSARCLPKSRYAANPLAQSRSQDFFKPWIVAATRFAGTISSINSRLAAIRLPQSRSHNILEAGSPSPVSPRPVLGLNLSQSCLDIIC